ncbi:hypothetical protein PBY51_003882 [Eleginops maclovinus]|uniref:Uncharacterized protein n=1 Tax=Eleginops maclovinus TaxID=56733 RepID=A0AAN7XVX9_ELEMC|nr:hypothetical protein PBY51_003882 [Eleginops maclovinus]
MFCGDDIYMGGKASEFTEEFPVNGQSSRTDEENPRACVHGVSCLSGESAASHRLHYAPLMLTEDGRYRVRGSDRREQVHQEGNSPLASEDV